MNNYRLEELSEFIRNGASIKQFENAKGYPITRIETISDSYVNLERVGYADIMEFGKYEEYLLDIGDILMSHINSDKHLGKTAIFENENVKLIHGMNLLCIRPNKKIVSPKYLNYYFKSLDFKKQLPKITKKSVNQASFSVSDLKKLKCKIHSIENQKKIVEILDKSQELIDKRKKQIEELDLLVKSKFIEMFGDPVTNLKKWDKVAIGEMFEIKTGATPSRKENSYWEGGTIPWVKTTELKEYIINETEEYITEDGFNNSSVNLLPKDTILIAMYGQGKTRGMTGKLGIEATTNQACAAILPNNNENMDFVWYQLRLLYDELRALGQGGSQPNLNTNLVKTYQLIFPPVELQNEFERFIKHIDKLKFEMEKSLKELEENFNSLMQKIFKLDLL
ncbi:MAG: restriction endonuclease subunit S [Clostridium perfringens]|nr:restriction endonuclease subunit S [Clostridium perfringens]MDU3194501.1 restriction endonuclease subunit S [Clostridium perfringens]MDU3866446.1 restriction endonuclease subunit S [Clostridium perfringens]MDU6349263.1 restriction endonuclease subunit S [Clostridium perfringens]